MPFSIIEMQLSAPITWNNELIGSILYLGIGASVISFLCWNAAIARIGSVRTALFGNLIPIISTLEAVWLLDEKITWVHVASGVMVIAGLFIANTKKAHTPQKQVVPA
jgi:drug/metabolite transporter (DMT)-like permease